MRSLTLVMVALVFFWSGMLVAIAQRPTPQLVRTIHATPVKWSPPNCLEQFRVCKQQQRSAKTGSDK